ncbi:MAG: amidase [Terriglobales bacterium]
MKTGADFPTLARAVAQLRAGEVTSVALTESCLARIRERDRELNSFITVTSESALEQARQADRELRSGFDRGPLHGIPIALKDLIDVAGVKTTAASAQLADNVVASDSPVTRRLRDAGAVLLGKLNLHEFAYGGSGVISAFGAVKNPANPRYITGGSSSGSAAAVAAGFCFAAIGTDTAGSIRLPAACCGVVGFKPTYGAVSTEGVVELSRSLDHVGPLARNVEDARLVWEAIRDTAGGEHANESGARIGVMRRFFFDDLDSEVSDRIDAAIARIAKHFKVVENVDFAVDEDRTVQMRESWDYHQRWVRESPEKYDPQTLQRIRRGADVTDEQFRIKLAELRATRARGAAMFEGAGIDVLVTPTAPIPAPSFDEVLADPKTLRAKELVLLRNTRPFNVWGTPAISVPIGTTAAGLPMGMQFAAAPGQDALLLAFAAEFEKL